MLFLKQFITGYWGKIEYLFLIPIYMILSTIAILPIVSIFPPSFMGDFLANLLAFFIGFEMAVHPIHRHIIVEISSHRGLERKYWAHCLIYSFPLFILIIGFLMLQPDPTFLFGMPTVVGVILFLIISGGKRYLKKLNATEDDRIKCEETPPPLNSHGA